MYVSMHGLKYSYPSRSTVFLYEASYVYVYIHIHIYTHAHTHTHTHIYIYTHMHPWPAHANACPMPATWMKSIAGTISFMECMETWPTGVFLFSRLWRMYKCLELPGDQVGVPHGQHLFSGRKRWSGLVVTLRAAMQQCFWNCFDWFHRNPPQTGDAHELGL